MTAYKQVAYYKLGIVSKSRRTVCEKESFHRTLCSSVSTPHDSVARRTTISSSNLKSLFLNDSQSLTLLCQNFVPLLCTTLL